MICTASVQSSSGMSATIASTTLSVLRRFAGKRSSVQFEIFSNIYGRPALKALHCVMRRYLYSASLSCFSRRSITTDLSIPSKSTVIASLRISGLNAPFSSVNTLTFDGRYPFTSMNLRAIKRLNQVYAASSITCPYPFC